MLGYDRTTSPGFATPLVKTEKKISVVVVGGLSVALLNTTPVGRFFVEMGKSIEEQTTFRE